MAAWALATGGDDGGGGIRAVAAAARQQVRSLTAQQLATVAWACARLAHPDEAMLQALARAAPARMAEFNSQDLANTAWAFGRLEHPAPELFAAIGGAAKAMLDRASSDFSPQQLAMVARPGLAGGGRRAVGGRRLWRSWAEAGGGGLHVGVEVEGRSLGFGGRTKTRTATTSTSAWSGAPPRRSAPSGRTIGSPFAVPYGKGGPSSLPLGRTTPGRRAGRVPLGPPEHTPRAVGHRRTNQITLTIARAVSKY